MFGSPPDHLAPEVTIELNVERLDFHRLPGPIEDDSFLHLLVISLVEAVEVRVDLGEMMAVWLFEVIYFVLRLDLGGEDRSAVTVDDAGVGLALEPHFSGFSFHREVDPDRVSHVRVLARDMLEVGNGDFFLELVSCPVDAGRFLLLFQSVLLPVEDFAVTLEELARTVLLGGWNATRPVEVWLALPDVLRPLLLPIPLGEGFAIDTFCKRRWYVRHWAHLSR